MQGMPVNRDDNGLWCGARNLRRRKAEIAAVSEVQGQGFDEMKRAQVDKVVSILEDWARWQRAYSVFLGAPRRSLGLRPWRIGGYCGIRRAEQGSGTTGIGAGLWMRA
jgi:hypothetical protein